MRPAAARATRHARRPARAVAALTGVLGVVLGPALAACGDPKDNPAWQLAGHPGLLYDIKSYYERHGWEEGGRCTAPILEGATGSRVVEEDGRLEVTLSYYYRDWVRDGDDCDRLRPLRCGVMRECRGFATRTFTVKPAADRFEVLSMSGPQSRLRSAPPR